MEKSWKIDGGYGRILDSQGRVILLLAGAGAFGHLQTAAAAPDLLAAAKDAPYQGEILAKMAGKNPCSLGYLDRLRAAIAKAEGAQ